MTRRLSFMVGVSSSDSGDHSVGRMVKRLNCSTRERWVLPAVSARLTSSITVGSSASSAIVVGHGLADDRAGLRKRLEVCRRDVLARRRDDQLFLTVNDPELAVGPGLRDVAAVDPTLG